MNKFKFTIRGNEYDVEILKIKEGLANLEVNGTPYEVEIEIEKKVSKTPTLVRRVVKKEAEDIAKKEGGTPSPVFAPLAGTIMDVKVKPGDIVEKDQPLLIMEAMKMENNIKADRNGKVTDVKVNVGDSVLEGDLLVEIGS